MKLSLWVTKNCNMKCKYCYEGNMPDEPAMPEGNDYINAVLGFIAYACGQTNDNKVFIKLFGGEPLLRFAFIKNFVEAADKSLGGTLKLYYSVTTNGLLLNDEIAGWFEHNNVDCALSIDGDEETYSVNRKTKDGQSAWEKVDEAVRKLMSGNLRKSARMTYNSQTFRKLYDNCIYLVGRGFRTIRAVPDFFDDGWSAEHIPILEEEIRKINRYRSENKTVFFSLDDEDILKGRKGCSGGYGIFSIDDQGDVYPCTYVVGHDTYKIGNILRNSKIDLKYSDADHHLRQDCQGCSYYKCCKSGSCLYGNYKMTGDLYKSNGFFCEYQKILYRLKGI